MTKAAHGEGAAVLVTPPASRTFAADVWRRFRSAPGALVGAIVVGLILAAALAAPLVAPDNPLAQDVAAGAHGPSLHHLFGTDRLGRDIFSRIVYGSRVSIRIGFVAVGLALVVGTLLGLIGGYVGGAVDAGIGAVTDVMLALPSILLAIAITTLLGPSITNLMLAIGIVSIPQYARLARAAVLSVREREYVEAARAIGVDVPSILLRHILPNILAPLLVQATLGIATAELEAAGLSYLGLGARPPAPEWGAMLNDARDSWLSAPWALLFPGAAITTLVLGFNLLGDGLRDALDVQRV